MNLNINKKLAKYINIEFNWKTGTTLITLLNPYRKVNKPWSSEQYSRIVVQIGGSTLLLIH